MDFFLIKPLAYLDPGSGSVILQVLLATLLGVGVMVKLLWTRIKSLFGIPSNTEQEPPDDIE